MARRERGFKEHYFPKKEENGNYNSEESKPDEEKVMMELMKKSGKISVFGKRKERRFKNVCEDDCHIFKLYKRRKRRKKKFDLVAAQNKCERKAEETVSVEEVPELEIEKDSWFNKCLKRFEEKTDKLTENQIKEGNKWCNRMFEEFEHCVSDSPNNANSIEVNKQMSG